MTLGKRDEADGRFWHPPAAEPLTGRQFLELLFDEAGHAPKMGVASRPMIRIGGVFNPLVRELNETLYQFERPFVTDASKFQASFGPDAGARSGRIYTLPRQVEGLVRDNRVEVRVLFGA